MIAVIMAGGKGTRLSALTKDEFPKPMMPVDGKPILLRQVEVLKQNGIDEFIFIVGHLSEKITDYFGDGSKFGVKINYIIETQPLGSAGALFFLKDKIKDDFLLVFGDTIFDIDVNKMADFHKSKKSVATLFAHPNSHPFDSDLIVCDNDGKVNDILGKNQPRTFYHNLVNAAFFVLSPKALDVLQKPEKAGLEKDILMKLIQNGQPVYCYKSSEYIKDAGTVDRIDDVTRDLKSGLVSKRNLKNKQKAVFLDRDGTINVHIPFINNHKDIRLIDGAARAVKALNENGYLALVVTNQPVIARGECSFDELDLMHQVIETQLGKEGAYLDDLAFCPHHPHSGYEGEVKELKIDCDCRKPKTGMIDGFVKKYNVDLSQSFLVGDTTIDIQTAVNAGLKSILVLTGCAGEDKKYDVKPDYVCKDLADAVNLILRK